MRILSHRALRGPNFYARFPVTYMLLDIGELEEKPSDLIPGLPDRIKAFLPTMEEHRCSPGVRGGFFQRLDRGTWMGHIVEHIAIELQCLAGMEVGFGKTRETTEYGIYSVVYKHKDEECGIYAGEQAVKILQRLIDGDGDLELEPIVQRLREIRERNLFGPSTKGIIDEARRRGIPVQRLNSASHVMLGQGHLQEHIQASMTGRTTGLGVEIAADKERTKRILDEAGIAVPRGRGVERLVDARKLAERIGYPVVVKPLDGNHGRGITTNIRDEAELETAYKAAKKVHDTVIIERFLVGKDHRILLINGKLIAAARRDPAHVVGDGTRTVQQLIDRVNSDPRRGFGHEKVLTRIEVDGDSERMLAEQGLAVDGVPEKGQEVVLKSTANLSTGGTATDVTDELHPSIVFMAERVAALVGLDIMGIDVVAPHLRLPMEETGGGIVEVNAGPGLRMHLEPTHGEPRNVGKPIIDMLFPDGSDGRIPIVAVTGTNGKTTTVRLIAHCMKYAGGRVGLACTGFVEVENQVILRGDWSGPQAAQTVLRDPGVTHAAIEVARGGILRRGLGFDRCDVGVLLNVGKDHLGEGDIHDLEDLTRLKMTVPDAAANAVLNADDDLVWEARHKMRGRVIPFSMDPDHPDFRAHLAADPENVVVTVHDGAIVLRRGHAEFRVAEVLDIPMTLGGRARFNIANALAAVGACYAAGLKEEDVRAGLVTFDSTEGQNPGRMNLFDVGGIRILLDFGHNVPALQALDDVLPHLAHGGRILRVGYLAGNRRTEDLMEVGAAMTTHCDHLFISDPDPRGREEGETSQILREGAQKAGFPGDKITTAVDEWDNIDAALKMAEPGDLVVIQCEDHAGLIARIREMEAKAKEASDAAAEAKAEVTA
ncbi:MAG: cyanophycin synthetase [Thermoplasmatota archaeon]